jgi:hypothetical protein
MSTEPDEIITDADTHELLKVLDAVNENRVIKMRWTKANGELAARGWSSKVTMTVEASDVNGGRDIERFVNRGAVVAAAHLRHLIEQRDAAIKRAEAAEAELAALKGQPA